MKLINPMFVLIALALSGGCTDRQSIDAAADPPQEFMAIGTFNSADAAKGTVNISHAPVPAAGWPAMTMDFKLENAAEAANIEAGERVDLHFTIDGGMNATITHLAPVE